MIFHFPLIAIVLPGPSFLLNSRTMLLYSKGTNSLFKHLLIRKKNYIRIALYHIMLPNSSLGFFFSTNKVSKQLTQISRYIVRTASSRHLLLPNKDNLKKFVLACMSHAHASCMQRFFVAAF